MRIDAYKIASLGLKNINIKNLTIEKGYVVEIYKSQELDGIDVILSIYEANITGTLTASNELGNFSLYLMEDIDISGYVNFANLNPYFTKNLTITLQDGANVNIGDDFVSVWFCVTIDLSSCEGNTTLAGKFWDYNNKNERNTIILPKKQLHSNTTATGNSDCKYIGELPISVADNKITVSESAVKCGIKITYYTEYPIENLLRMNISQIAASESGIYNTNYNVLDVTQDKVEPMITADKTDIKFAVLTTPSTGITIAKDAEIMTPISIRLKLD